MQSGDTTEKQGQKGNTAFKRDNSSEKPGSPQRTWGSLERLGGVLREGGAPERSEEGPPEAGCLLREARAPKVSGGRPSEAEHRFREAGVPLKKLGGEAGPSEKGRGALSEAGGPPQRAGGGRAPSQRQGVPQKSGASIREGGRPSEKWR